MKKKLLSIIVVLVMVITSGATVLAGDSPDSPDSQDSQSSPDSQAPPEPQEPQGYVGLSAADRERLRTSRHPYYITINRQRNVIVVYERGPDGLYSVPVRSFLCSTGDATTSSRTTPEGLHTSTTRKWPWRFMFDGSYCQYTFVVTGNYAMHSVPYWTRDKSDMKSEMFLQLGQSVSGGCIRMTVVNAKWIYDNCVGGTLVRIFDHPDDGPWGRPEATPFDINSPNRGWDPTDPDPRNPWNGGGGATQRSERSTAPTSPTVPTVPSDTTFLAADTSDISTEAGLSGDTTSTAASEAAPVDSPPDSTTDSVATPLNNGRDVDDRSLWWVWVIIGIVGVGGGVGAFVLVKKRQSK